MPMLIGALPSQVVDSQPPGGILTIAKLTCPSTEMVAQLALGWRHVRIWLVVMDSHRFQRCASALLSHIPGLNHHPLKLISQISN